LDTRVADDPEAIGVYVHWPFCAQKCPYCDFNSHVRFGGWDEARYLAAYRAELDHAAHMTGPRDVSSIFFGGGTPSLMSPETVGAIIACVRGLWCLSPDAEITLEANPGSVEAGRFRGYRAAGVNRVSLGVQSLREDELKRLGRIHSVVEAVEAVEIARATFDRFSFDLIYARPGQTVAAWRAELDEALALAGRHLSAYQLTIEPGTPFFDLHARGKLVVPDPDLALAMYEATEEMCAAAGLPAYEVSNYASPGEESRHNRLYWRYGSYVGAGPGAHGRPEQQGQRLATVTERSPERWLALVETQGHGIAAQEVLTPPQMADEMLLMGLRVTEGVDLDRLERLGGVAPGAATIEALCGQGLLERPSASRLRASPRGRLVLNELVLRLSESFTATGETLPQPR